MAVPAEIAFCLFGKFLTTIGAVGRNIQYHNWRVAEVFYYLMNALPAYTQLSSDIYLLLIGVPLLNCSNYLVVSQWCFCLHFILSLPPENTSYS